MVVSNVCSFFVVVVWLHCCSFLTACSQELFLYDYFPGPRSHKLLSWEDSTTLPSFLEALKEKQRTRQGLLEELEAKSGSMSFF
eukprot:m.65778 g.65778  ORF g.65778 m.65778 type:complete len:84 (+) comp35327_c0_seq8:17-268(+)